MDLLVQRFMLRQQESECAATEWWLQAIKTHVTSSRKMCHSARLLALKRHAEELRVKSMKEQG